MTQMPLATQIFADFLEIALIKSYHVKYKLMEKEFILQQIEKGQKDIKEGKIFTTKQAKIRLAKWLK